MYPLYVASRHLLKRVSCWVATLFVSLFIVLYLTIISVMEGFKQHWMERLIGMRAHLEVAVGDFGGGVIAHRELMEKLSRVKQVTGCAPYRQGSCLIRTERYSGYGALRGVKLARELEQSALGGYIVEATGELRRYLLARSAAKGNLAETLLRTDGQFAWQVFRTGVREEALSFGEKPRDQVILGRFRRLLHQEAELLRQYRNAAEPSSGSPGSSPPGALGEEIQRRTDAELYNWLGVEYPHVEEGLKKLVCDHFGRNNSTVKKYLRHHGEALRPRLAELAGEYLQAREPELFAYLGEVARGVVAPPQAPQFDRQRARGGTLHGCLVGHEWAKAFRMGPGEELFVITDASRGLEISEAEPRVKGFVVLGVFQTTNPYLDRSIYIDLEVAGDMLGTVAPPDQEPGVRGVSLWTAVDPTSPELDRVAAACEKVLKEHVRTHPSYDFLNDRPGMRERWVLRARAQTWQHIDNTWYRGVTRQAQIMRVIMVIFLAGVCVFIFFIMLVMVRDKTRDIGLLRALGSGAAAAGGVFLSQGLVIGLVGVALGLPLARLMIWKINPLARFLGLHEVISEEIFLVDYIPTHVTGYDQLLICGLCFLTVVVAAFMPALLAALREPVRCLRHE